MTGPQIPLMPELKTRTQRLATLETIRDAIDRTLPVSVATIEATPDVLTGRNDDTTP